MKTFAAPLEVRDLPPIEIPQCEIVLPIARKWFEELNHYNLSPGSSIAAIVSPGSLYVNGVTPREDFASIWNRGLKVFAHKIPRKGEVVRALIPMRRAVFDCLCSVSKAIGESEALVAQCIIARAMEIESDKRQKMYREASSRQPAAPPPDVESTANSASNVVPGPWKPRQKSSTHNDS